MQRYAWVAILTGRVPRKMSAMRISYVQKVNEEHGPEQQSVHKTSAEWLMPQGQPRPRTSSMVREAGI